MWNRRPAVQSLSAELTPISLRSILTLRGVMVMPNMERWRKKIIELLQRFYHLDHHVCSEISGDS